MMGEVEEVMALSDEEKDEQVIDQSRVDVSVPQRLRVRGDAERHVEGDGQNRRPGEGGGIEKREGCYVRCLDLVCREGSRWHGMCDMLLAGQEPEKEGAGSQWFSAEKTKDGKGVRIACQRATFLEALRNVGKI